MIQPYNEEELLLFQEVAIWEDQYRTRYCTGRTDEELISAGWWKEEDGEWYSWKFAKARERRFAKKLQNVVSLRLTAVAAPPAPLQELQPES